MNEHATEGTAGKLNILVRYEAPSVLCTAPHETHPRETNLPTPAELPSLPRRIAGWIILTGACHPTMPPSSTRCGSPVRTSPATYDFARTLTDLRRHRRGFLLQDWIRPAEQTTPAPVTSKAGSLCQDIDAVLDGLIYDYSSGVVRFEPALFIPLEAPGQPDLLADVCHDAADVGGES
jgi:hypothetical protein